MMVSRCILQIIYNFLSPLQIIRQTRVHLDTTNSNSGMFLQNSKNVEDSPENNPDKTCARKLYVQYWKLKADSDTFPKNVLRIGIIWQTLFTFHVLRLMFASGSIYVLAIFRYHFHFHYHESYNLIKADTLSFYSFFRICLFFLSK